MTRFLLSDLIDEMPERREALANDLFQRLRADEQRRLVWEALGINPTYLSKIAEGKPKWMN
jgi:hypothetical protein